MIKAGPGTRRAQYIKESFEDYSGLKLALEKKKSVSFYIYPPVLADVQRARQGGTYFHQGAFVRFKRDEVEIGLGSTHSPAIKEIFLKNTGQSELELIAKKLAQLSDGDAYMYWDSAIAQKLKNKTIEQQEFLSDAGYFCCNFDSLRGFKSILDVCKIKPESWVNDTMDGRHFEISAFFYKHEAAKIDSAIKLLAKYLQNFLPSDKYKTRVDNLRRFLVKLSKEKAIPKICAHKGCQRVRDLEAAHIKRYIDGGGDDPRNGIWLCHEHHLLQENTDRKWHLKNLKFESIKHSHLVPQIDLIIKKSNKK